tara:strand:- start:541 stop:672 length:132 start_codon:yes stop_codon:yes gene_type:complete
MSGAVPLALADRQRAAEALLAICAPKIPTAVTARPGKQKRKKV